MKDLIATLKTGLESISGVREVFMYRDATPTKYPALTCVWDSTDSSPESTRDNRKTATFRLYLQVNIAGKTMSEIDETIIPQAYDDISAYIDEHWNFGTSVEGHRMWSNLSMAESRVSIEDKSKIAYISFTLKISYLKDN